MSFFYQPQGLGDIPESGDSLIVEFRDTSGDWQHHLRWPWGVNLHEWRNDVHVAVGAPSLTVIPPPAIHTSTWSAPGENHLVDVFSPPRLDFSTHAAKGLYVVDSSIFPTNLGVNPQHSIMGLARLCATRVAEKPLAIAAA